jgi:hypothetical protein
VDLSSAAWQEIRVRSGRDDKGEGGAFNREWLVDERNRRFLGSARNDKGKSGAPIKSILIIRGN